MQKFLVLILSLALLFTLTSCSDSTDPTPAPGDPAPILHEETIMVDDQPMVLNVVSGSDYTFTHTGVLSRTPQVGDILVGEPSFTLGKDALPHQVTGYVRKITSITPIGLTTFRYRTVQGYLTEAVKEWKVNKSIALVIAPPDIPIPGYVDFLLPGVTFSQNRINFTNVTLFDGTASSGGASVRLKAVLNDGFLAIKPVQTLKLTIMDSEILEYSAVTTMNATFGCDLTVEASARLHYAPPPKKVWEKTDVKVAPVFFPVVHVITQTVSIGFTFTAEGGVQMDVNDIEGSLKTETGFQFEAEGGYEPIQKTTYSLVYGDPVWSAWAQAEIRPYVLYRVVDKFYGIAGPALWFKPFLSLTGDTDFETEWCIHCSIGMEMGVGCSVGFLSKNMFSWDSPSLFTPQIDLFNHCEDIEWGNSTHFHSTDTGRILLDQGPSLFQ